MPKAKPFTEAERHYIQSFLHLGIEKVAKDTGRTEKEVAAFVAKQKIQPIIGVVAKNGFGSKPYGNANVIVATEQSSAMGDQARNDNRNLSRREMIEKNPRTFIPNKNKDVR